MGVKANVGDVFLIPLEDSGFGLGQVAGDWKGELYLLIFEHTYDTRDVDPECVLAAAPLFAALSLDAKIHNGDWPVIVRVTDNLAQIPQPVFKVDQGGRMFLESRDRSVSRPVTQAEEESLRLRTVVAPVRLENALKALNGIGEWNPRYEELRFTYALESSRMLAG
jgi:hypothetical protein